MKEKTFNHSKYNIAWISFLVIFVGTIIYPVVFENADRISKTISTIEPTTIPTAPVLNVTPIETMPAQNASSTAPLVAKTETFTRNLKLGDRGADVKKLQEYLNKKGFIVATSGNGSIGHETELFGPGTERALKAFQESYADILLKPFGLSEGTGFLGQATRDFINS